ncbi:MAG: glycosyltransferase family 2 protein [Curvibacter sp.]|nr:MAG: glycosyltransferase family 2 protein [Curvibacter sp.]
MPSSLPPQRPRLSVCMIVRDEAVNLPGALKSVRDVAHELIVVDTGSTDDSPAIAQHLGAQVLHFAWCDDFARARNVALEAATGDWVLCLDADQQLDPACVPALQRALQRQDALAQRVTIQLLTAADDDLANPLRDGRALAVLQSFPQLRLFRRDPRIRFQGRVHEDVADSLLAIGSSDWPESGVRLCDHGYVQAAERERKRARNLALLQRVHDEAPDALYPAYKLAISLPAHQQAEQAALLESTLGRVLQMPASEQSTLPFLPTLLARTVDAWVQQGRLLKAAQVCRRLLELHGPVFDFTAGCALARAGEWAPARHSLLRYLAAPAQAHHAAWQADPQASPAQACWWLAWMARQQGELEQAQVHVQEGLHSATPLQRAALEAEGVEILLARGEWVAAAQAIGAMQADSQAPALALSERLRVSARLAELTGDLPTALSLAQSACLAGHDAPAALLAMLEIQAGQVDEARLQHHHQSLAGQFFDTLALKWLMARELGLPWPLDLPPATQALIAPPVSVD